MKKRIYASLLLMGLVSIAITLSVCTWAYWGAVEEEALAELSTVAEVMSSGMGASSTPEAYLQDGAHSSQGTLRVTWINADGTVQYESDYDAAAMENHQDRREVQQAFENGAGHAVRRSATLGKSLYYVADRLPDGSVLRISEEKDLIYGPFFAMLPVLICLMVLLGFLCFDAARRLTDKLLQPLEQMADYLVHVRDTEHISQAMLPDYHEIQPFVGKIIEQGHQIEETIQTLQHERNTVQLMLENMEEGVLLADGEGRLVVVNASAAQILHCARPDEALGICITELLPEVKLEVSPQAEAAHRDLLEKDGNIYHVRVRPIINDGQNYGTLVMLSDITEMEQREQFRREFTSNVSHELKTPLTSIRGFAEMLAAGMYGKKADVAHFGKRICQESQRLLHLIESIIALTHIEEVRRDAVHGPVELRPIIEDVVSFMEPVTVEEKVELHLELTDAVVRGNAAMLREMVMNLIDNAVKYNRAGGHVYVKMQADEGSLRFSVQDTGIGIPPEKQKRVFERFYRVEGSRNKKSGGSGLGLSIVKHIVLQHQGRISLQSQAGLGTTIEVILPLYDGQGLPPEARPVSGQYNLA